MPDLTCRRREPEVMDAPGLDPREHERALGALARINAVSRVAALYWARIAPRAGAAGGGRPLRILDVACGGGDVLRALALRAARAGVAVELIGCDVQPTALDLARRAAERAGLPIRFVECDVLTDELPGPVDVALTSLFLHHLDEADVVRLLKKLAATAEQMVLASDLVRGATGWWAAWLGGRLLTRSPVVHYDGPVSVAAAFRPGELAALAREAGLTGARITRHWPWRMLLAWRRGP